jgi:hypothetical protein
MNCLTMKTLSFAILAIFFLATVGSCSKSHVAAKDPDPKGVIVAEVPAYLIGPINTVPEADDISDVQPGDKNPTKIGSFNAGDFVLNGKKIPIAYCELIDVPDSRMVKIHSTKSAEGEYEAIFLQLSIGGAWVKHATLMINYFPVNGKPSLTSYNILLP